MINLFKDRYDRKQDQSLKEMPDMPASYSSLSVNVKLMEPDQKPALKQ
jgi:hypothetical protein